MRLLVLGGSWFVGRAMVKDALRRGWDVTVFNRGRSGRWRTASGLYGAIGNGRRFPWGDQPWDPTRANLRGSGFGWPRPVGDHPSGVTPEGVQDVAGNVWEWTAGRAMGGGAVIRGGSFASIPAYAQCTFLNVAPAELRSPGIGLRVVREP